jgi:hypothetical protein
MSIRNDESVGAKVYIRVKMGPGGALPTGSETQPTRQSKVTIVEARTFPNGICILNSPIKQAESA